MKKLIWFSVLVAALSASATETSDSYIYWMLSDDAYGKGGLDETDLGGTYTAKIAAFQGSSGWLETGATYLNIWSSGAGGVKGTDLGNSGVEVVIGTGADNLPYYVGLASSVGADWTYFVELYNDRGRLVARSADADALPYSKSSIAALDGLGTPGKAWMPVQFVAAPEPNSALLMLIGCAVLVLRRRKES